MRSVLVIGFVRWAVQLMGWLIVVWLITGCGRIGFETVTLDSSNEWIIQMVALRPR